MALKLFEIKVLLQQLEYFLNTDRVSGLHLHDISEINKTKTGRFFIKLRYAINNLEHITSNSINKQYESLQLSKYQKT